MFDRKFGADFLAGVPSEPGVYHLYDASGALLYVGKARDLRRRRFGPNQRTFNTPVLVEAADTGPFFHNNSIATIEGAVAFYTSAAFNSSPIGSLIPGGCPRWLDTAAGAWGPSGLCWRRLGEGSLAANGAFEQPAILH